MDNRVWVESAGMTDGKLRAAAREVDITSDFGWMRSGFAVESPVRALHGRLRAHILVIDDGAGERVALIAVDLHAGTRLLTERVAWRLAKEHPTLGLDLRRIVISGTHTHSGPWRIYGNTFYDMKTWSGLNLDPRPLSDVVEGMATRIVDGVVAAVAALAPARVGIGAAITSGVVHNRSLPAAQRNALAWPSPTTTAEQALASDEAKAFEPTMAAEQMNARCAAVVRAWTHAPDDASFERAIVDRRVRAVWAETTAGAPIGAYLAFAAHNAMIPKDCDVGSADFFGWAGRMLGDALTQGGARPMIGFTAGSTGDADPHPERPWADIWPFATAARDGWTSPDEPEAPAVLEWTRRFAVDLAKAGRAAIDDARAHLVDRLPIVCRCVEWSVDEDPPPASLFPSGAVAALGKPWIGWPTTRGSELGAGIYLSYEGDRDGRFRASDPQSPKLEASSLEVTKINSFHLVRLGETWLVGLPGEPTTFFARLMAEAVDPANPSRPIILGVTGDYRGYLTTPHEFVAQHYEGSSTIYGRHTARWYFNWLRRAADTSKPPKPLAPSAGFLHEGASAEQRYEALRHDKGQAELGNVDLHIAGVNGQSQVVEVTWRGRLPRDVSELRGNGLCSLRAIEEPGAASFQTSDQESDGVLSFTEPLSPSEMRWRWRVLLPKPLKSYARIEASVRQWHGAPTEHQGALVVAPVP